MPEIPAFDSNDANRNEPVANGRAMTWMKVEALISGEADLVYARLWDGLNKGTTDILVYTTDRLAVGETFYATRPEGGTGKMYGDPEKPVVWMQVGGGRSGVVVKVGTAVAGSGKYNGIIYTGFSEIPVAGNLALPEGLTAGASCLVVNVDEDTAQYQAFFIADTHWIKPDTFAIGFYLGMSTEATPRPTIVIPMGSYYAEPTTTLSGAADSWHRARATSGTAYGDSTHGIVFEFVSSTVKVGSDSYKQRKRTMVVAADGRIVSISAEVESAI